MVNTFLQIFEDPQASPEKLFSYKNENIKKASLGN
tara:strand:+ start:314 stop:418 length:105 start_codon:yes stop_codon:yes gene_type:complete